MRISKPGQDPFLSPMPVDDSLKETQFESPFMPVDSAPGVVERYDEFGHNVLNTPLSESPSNLSLGVLSDDSRYLFVETPQAKEAALQFMQVFLSSGENQKLCEAIDHEKIDFLKSLYPEDEIIPRQVTPKCLGFTILDREIENGEQEKFCLVTLSGTDEGEVTGTFSRLTQALSSTALALNEQYDQYQFIFSANPSVNFRELIALEQDEGVATNWRKACAELPAVKWLCEIFSNPDYLDQLSIGGGMFMFLPKSHELFAESVTVKPSDARKKGYFKIDAGMYEFKGRPIPACRDCQDRKDRYVQLIQAAVKKAIAQYVQEDFINVWVKMAMYSSEQNIAKSIGDKFPASPEHTATPVLRNPIFTRTPDRLPGDLSGPSSVTSHKPRSRSKQVLFSEEAASPQDGSESLLVKSLDAFFAKVQDVSSKEKQKCQSSTPPKV